MQANKGIWIGVAVVVLVAIVGFWLLNSGTPIQDRLSGSGGATTTTEGGATGTVPNTKGRAIVTSNQDVATIVAGLSGASQFKSLFVSTGISATINPGSTSKYTIFVPTDGSIGQLTPGTISNLSADEKKRLIQHHVISGRAIDPEAMGSGQQTALSGDMLNFSFGPDGVPMVNSAIIVTQYNGTNGVVYLIDNVLLPPQAAN